MLVLAQVLAQMKDRGGRIKVPGFYDDVRQLTEQERQEFKRLPFDEKRYFAQIGVDGAIGEEGYTALERRWARPTCDVNGIWAAISARAPRR